EPPHDAAHGGDHDDPGDEEGDGARLRLHGRPRASSASSTPSTFVSAETPWMRNQPLLSSSTSRTGSCAEWIDSSRGSMSSMFTIVPLSRMNATESGTNVLRM